MVEVLRKAPHALLFARCDCPKIHWAVRGCYIGCRECLQARREATDEHGKPLGYFATYVVLTFQPRKVRRELEANPSPENIQAIIERENATLPRGRAA